MYAIREEPHYSRLRITLSGRVPTDEALRALRQAAVLLQTDGLREVLCDVTMLERGPGKLLLLAAFLATEIPANTRLAIRSGDHQLRLSQRFLRFSGLGSRVRCFSDDALLDEWLEDQRSIVRPMSADVRHLEMVTSEARPAKTRKQAVQVGPAA